jgi:mRNA interferase MazF
MPRAGDVVTVDFPGAQGIKRRPAVIVSTDTYHKTRPDVILGLLTTQVDSATTPTDFILQDWASAGLHNPSAFRTFLVTMPASSIKFVGHLSDRDWRQAQECLKIAIATR